MFGVTEFLGFFLGGFGFKSRPCGFRVPGASLLGFAHWVVLV